MIGDKLFIDPPSGWKYGFPKEVPNDIMKQERLDEWLIEQGYPEEDIDLAMKHSRFWYE